MSRLHKIIPDNRVIQAARFLRNNPEASLDDLCRELELGWSMAATIYREAAIKYVAKRYGKKYAKPIKQAVAKLAPHCTQSF